jgi:AAA domain
MSDRETAAQMAVVDQCPDGSETLPNAKPEAVVKPLLDLQPAMEDDGNTLLGNRFLCRGAGLELVGPSGIGKSTAIVQMGIFWAVGRECFGIPPKQSLKILYVQAENDEGDLCEMRDGVLQHLQLNGDELKLLDRNFICAFEFSRVGEELFADTLEPLLTTHSPDLLILDPALSYIGGDANEQATVVSFSEICLILFCGSTTAARSSSITQQSRLQPRLRLIAWPPIMHISERARRNGRIGLVLCWFLPQKMTMGCGNYESAKGSGWAGKTLRESRARADCYVRIQQRRESITPNYPRRNQ